MKMFYFLFSISIYSWCCIKPVFFFFKKTEPSVAKTDVVQKQKCLEQQRFLKRIFQLSNWEQSDPIYQQYYGSGCVGTRVFATEEHSPLVRSTFTRTASFTTLEVGGPRVLLQQLLIGALPSTESLFWMSNPDICPEMSPVDHAGWDSADEQQLSLSVAPLGPLAGEMKESHPVN